MSFVPAAIGFLLAMAGANVAAAQEPEIVVSGAVVNGTSGGAVQGQTVVFHQDRPTGHVDLEASTDQDGGFLFGSIVFDPEATYAVSTIYQGGLYGADLDLSGGSPPPVSITVYEATDSDEVVRATAVSVLLADADGPSQTVSALEIVRIVNESNLAYVPGPEPMQLLRFGLPPGASDLSVQTDLPGADVFQVDLGFGLSAAVPPGSHEVMFAYRIPYSRAEYTFVKSLRYGATLLRVLAPAESVQFASADLGTPEEVDIGGRAYRLLSATEVPRGARVTIDLTRLPLASLNERVSKGFGAVRWELAAPVALGGFLTLLLAALLWRRATGRVHADEEAAGPAVENDERGAMIRMIADLDGQLESGEISDAQHERRRSILRARLSAATERRQPRGK